MDRKRGWGWGRRVWGGVVVRGDRKRQRGQPNKVQSAVLGGSQDQSRGKSESKDGNHGGEGQGDRGPGNMAFYGAEVFLRRSVRGRGACVL